MDYYTGPVQPVERRAKHWRNMEAFHVRSADVHVMRPRCKQTTVITKL